MTSRDPPAERETGEPATDGGTGTGPLAIETTELTKRYGDVTAVADLSLSIPRGIVYGFLGPNGSGKTTTMRMLTTLAKPTAGEALINGVDIRDREAVIEHVGYLPEKPPVYEELTGREQLHHAAALHDIPEAEASERIDSYLERFDLEAAADRRIEGYSKGMRQKVGIAQALLHEPTVVFLDEPTSGLDPRAARTVKDLVAEFADTNRTIFLSTHILSVVDELADDVGVLHHGDLVAEGSPTELKRRAEAGSGSLEDVFLSITDDHDAEAAAVEEGAVETDGGRGVDETTGLDGGRAGGRDR